MKVAIPSNDGVTIYPHFGRSQGFKIYDIEDGKILKDVYLNNTFTQHQIGGAHDHQGEHKHDGSGQGGHNHSHQGIFSALDGVTDVIAGGMGARLFDEFSQRKINVIVTDESNISSAIEKFLSNNLPSNPDSCCQH